MGVLNTTYTFTATDVVTSAKLNNVIDETTFTANAITGTTLALSSGQLKVNTSGIGANELANDSVTTVKILDGSVTSGKLAAGAALPAGAVMPFAMATAPTGWFSCDGALLSRTTYALLFAAIGTTFGVGDGSTTFAIPDLRGYFVRGFGTNSDTVASGAFGAKQTASLLNHTHSGTTGYISSDHAHNYTRWNTIVNNLSLGGNVDGIWQNQLTVATGGVSSNHVHAFTTGDPSVGGGSETRPANIALLYCIKY